MPVLNELPEPNAAHHGVLDRKSILRSTVPKRKGPTSSKLIDFPENHSNNKFLDLIQYYECLDHRSSARPAGKDKTTVPSSASTTPDLPEYESSSTGSRSTATPDFLFPKPSSVISDSDSRTDSPDLGYSSKRSSRQYEDNATSNSGSRNISPENGFHNLIPRHNSDQKVKKSESPDLGYATTPEKGPFKSYGDMRYLLDLKIPAPSDSESNSLPKSDLEKKPYDQNLEYKLDSRSNSEFNSSEKISDSKYTDSLGQKMALESDGTSASKRSSFCIEELDPESFSNLEDFSFEVTLGRNSNHTRQMESLERRIGNMSSIIEHDDTLKNKCFDEEDSDNPDSKDPLNYTNLFEYEAPNNLEPDYARYKLAFDITESDFSANTPADDRYDGFRKRSSDSQSSDIVYDKDPNENTTLGNSEEFQYDGILDSKLNQNYPTYEYEPVNGLESTTMKLLEVKPFETGAKSGSSMSQYSDLKFDEYSNELYNLEKGTTKTSREVPEIKFPKNMFTIDCENGRPGSELKDEDPKTDRPEMKTPDSMFSFACEDKPASRMSNFSDGLNVEPKVNPDEAKVKSSTEKRTEEEKEEEYNHPSSLDPRSDSRSSQVSFSLKYGPDEVRPDSRLSDTSCGFGLGEIPESYEPSTSPRLDYMPEPRTRYSMADERTKVHRRSPDLVKGKRDTKGKRLSLDVGAVSKPVPHYMDNLFPMSGYRYSLPKPSDFLSDSFIKREAQSQNQSLNLSTESRLKVGSLSTSMDHSIDRSIKPLNQSMNSSIGQNETKRKAMRNFMSSCINEGPANVSLADVSTASSIPPPLPSQPPPSLDESGHHKMKIDLHTVDYIMNNRRRSCLKKDSSNTSRDFADEETYDDHNYSIVSLIGALEELGIEVEFNEPDEQHRRRTMGRNTSLMESVLEEDEEWKEEKESAEESKSKIGKHQLNEIKEADEIAAEVSKAPSPVFNTPTRLVHQPSEAENKSSENKTEEIKTEDKFDLHMGTPKDMTFRLERPGSPVLSSSKKLKFLQRRSTETCKTNLEKVIEPQPSVPPQQNLESTRQLFVDSSVKICKLDNSISTISMTTSASREVSPVTETQPSISKENCLAPTNLCKVLDAEDFKLSRNAEFDKIERYAKVSTLRTGKVEKVKRNSFTRKYHRVNRKCNDTTTVESIPSVVENFLTDALGSEKDNYETTIVDDTFTNTNDIEFTDSNLFTADESGTVDLDQSLRRSISDLALSAKNFLKNTTRKKKSSRRRWSELQEEMHVLLDSVSKQQLMIQQASKALKMCYTFKEFENSEEHVESERILLLAHKRKTAAMDAINLFAQKSKKLIYENYGDITLNKIVLPLNTSEKYDKKNDSVEWYMVVIQNGLTVLGSQPVMRQKNSHEIIFPDPFFLPKVDPDFKLTFEIYRLKLKKKGGISHELKYHIRGSYSLADAWYKAISKLTQRSNPSKQNRIRLTKMFESSFMLIGQVEFSLKDLSRSSPWTLQEAHPILEGTIKMSFSCNVDLTESNAGWLTHGTDLKGYTVWNRRWCVLVGHVLKFWDYPTEDPEEKPIMELNLIHCKDSEIGIVDRELCAKPRTIMLEFDELKNVSDYDSTNDSNIREQRNFLTLDTNRDLDEWLTKINRVLQALKSWNAKC